MKNVLFVLAVLVIAMCATSVLAQSLQLLAEEQYLYGASNPIPIWPGDIERFWAHIIWAGHENEDVQINGVSWQWWSHPTGDATSELKEWYVNPPQTVRVSQWFEWNKVQTWGKPSTLIDFQAGVAFIDASGTQHEPIFSNIVTKHIVPEPGASALASFGLPAASTAVVLWRRKRK